MKKKYKGIFFDWDGTAVLSRKAPVEAIVKAMGPLLDQKVNLVIVSGTTMENIAGGKLDSYFTKEQLEHLYLGLGRGLLITDMKMDRRLFSQTCFRTGNCSVIFTGSVLTFTWSFWKNTE